MILLCLGLTATIGLASTCRALARSRVAREGGDRRARWERRLAEFLTRAGVRGTVSPWAFVALSLASAAFTGGSAFLLLAWPLIALVAAVAGLALPGLYFDRRRERREGEMRGALVDAIDQLRASLGGGQSVQQGLAELARSGPAPLRPAFGDLARELQRYGVTPALRRMQTRLADPLVDTFASALIMNDRIGGRQIGPVLEQLARAARAELLLKEEARAQQASIVLQARAIAAMPWLLLVLLREANRGYLAPFDSGTGQAILVLCGAATVIAYRAMRWLGRLPDEGRVRR